MLNATIRTEERALLKRGQEECDITATVDDIQRQVDEGFSENEAVTSRSIMTSLSNGPNCRNSAQ